MALDRQREMVRVMLLRNYLKQSWLLDRLLRMGIKTCKSELSDMLSNRRKGPKAQAVITASYEVLIDYEKKMNG